jgi:Putative bacterial sensory transduction regulator
MATTPISLLKEVIEDLEYSVELEPATEPAPFERLRVTLGTDRAGRPLVAQILFLNDVVLAQAGAEDLEETKDAILLQFMVLLPERVEAEHMGSVIDYLTQINRIVTVGSFGLSRPDGTVYFQYALALPEREVDDNVLIEVIQMIDFFVKKFGNEIIQIASGSLTVDAAFAAMAEEGITPPPLAEV